MNESDGSTAPEMQRCPAQRSASALDHQHFDQETGHTMRVGIPTEIKNNENRVAITQAGVFELKRRGHEVR